MLTNSSTLALILPILSVLWLSISVSSTRLHLALMIVYTCVLIEFHEITPVTTLFLVFLTLMVATRYAMQIAPSKALDLHAKKIIPLKFNINDYKELIASFERKWGVISCIHLGMSICISASVISRNLIGV